eukprot:UN29708
MDRYRDNAEDDDFGGIAIDLDNFDKKDKRKNVQQEEEPSEGEEDDPFQDVSESENEGDYKKDKKKDIEVKNILRNLENNANTRKILDYIQRLSKIFVEDRQQISLAMSNHGVIPIMELLDHKQHTDPRTITKTLNLITQFTKD